MVMHNRDYWREHLGSEALPVLALPTDKPRGPKRTYNAGWVPVEVDNQVAIKVKALHQQDARTLFDIALATWTLLLCRTSGQEVAIVGAAFHGRVAPKTDRIIGPFANTLPMKVEAPRKGTVSELMRSANHAAMGVIHAALGLEQIVQELLPQHPKNTPLCQAGLRWNNGQKDSLYPPGSDAMPPWKDKISWMGRDGGPRTMLGGEVEILPEMSLLERGTLPPSLFDATFVGWTKVTGVELMGFEPESIHGGIEYNCDLFSKASIEKLVAVWPKLLAEFAVFDTFMKPAWEVGLSS